MGDTDLTVIISMATTAPVDDLRGDSAREASESFQEQESPLVA